MSNSITAAQGPPAKASLPIELLPTDLARIFTHIHSALLLSAYYTRFPALVADPTSTLLSSLAPLVVIQTIYAIICLPVIGSASKPVKKVKFNAPKMPEGQSGMALVRFPYPIQRSLLILHTDYILSPRPLPHFGTSLSSNPSPIRSSNHNTHPTHTPQLRTPSFASSVPLGLRTWSRWQEMEGDSLDL